MQTTTYKLYVDVGEGKYSVGLEDGISVEYGLHLEYNDMIYCPKHEFPYWNKLLDKCIDYLFRCIADADMIIAQCVMEGINVCYYPDEDIIESINVIRDSIYTKIAFDVSYVDGVYMICGMKHHKKYISLG